MVSGMKATGILIVAATVSGLAVPAYSQGFSKNGGGYAGPPVENHPKIDEKAYKAALERIPAPGQKYDPWGVARPDASAKIAKKPNHE
jgi:hypothetical protein